MEQQVWRPSGWSGYDYLGSNMNRSVAEVMYVRGGNDGKWGQNHPGDFTLAPVGHIKEHQFYYKSDG